MSSGQVAGPVAAETDLSDALFCEPSGTETVLSNVERCDTQFRGAVSAPAGGGEVLRAAETDFGGAQCLPGADASRSDPMCGQREVANVQLASSAGVSGHVGTDVRRMGSFGGAVPQACSAGVKLAGAGGRAAGTGRRAKRAEARGERAEAGSVSFEHDSDSDVLLSCRVESPSSRVARVNSALHICVLITVLLSLHIIHTRVCLMHEVW